MTTINNTINTENKSLCFPVRATFLNGDYRDMLLDVTALDAKYIAPVINGLLDGEVSADFDIPLVREKIQKVNDICVEHLVDYCMDYGYYDHCYTIDLILTAMEKGWCCEHCGSEEIKLLEHLNQELENGNDQVSDEIEANLTKFFGTVLPFSIEFR